jgi:site-specific recombinase XerD
MGAAGVERAVTGYLDHLAVERGLAANTLAAYRRDLARYTDHLSTRASTTPRRCARTTSRTSWPPSAPATTGARR